MLLYKLELAGHENFQLQSCAEKFNKQGFMRVVSVGTCWLLTVTARIDSTVFTKMLH